MNRLEKWAPSLERQFEYVLSRSLFYRHKLAGFSDLLPHFKELPFTTKAEVLKDQEAHPPFGSGVCAGIRNVRRVHKTSGTSGRPVLIALTDRDVDVTVRVGRDCFLSSGLTPDDMVVHCLNYNLWAGGYTDHQSLEAAGAAVVPFGVGHSRTLIETMLLLHPTAIHCTPSYLAKLEAVLKTDYGGKPPGDLGLRLGLFGGESGMQNPAFRKAIESLWGLKAMNANYGMADVLSMFGAECRFQNGLHFMAEGVLLPELVEPQSGCSVPIAAGAEGELVLTHIGKEAQPLIRFRTSDVIRILSDESCACGLDAFRFEVLGRSDDMIVIRGVNVFIGAVDRLIGEHLDELTGLFQAFINKTDPVDRMVLKIETRGGGPAREQEMRRRLADDFKARLTISPSIEFVPEGSLPRTEGKTQKLFRSL
jgi:phenylacetate-CoA ligase